MVRRLRARGCWTGATRLASDSMRRGASSVKGQQRVVPEVDAQALPAVLLEVIEYPTSTGEDEDDDRRGAFEDRMAGQLTSTCSCAPVLRPDPAAALLSPRRCPVRGGSMTTSVPPGRAGQPRPGTVWWNATHLPQVPGRSPEPVVTAPEPSGEPVATVLALRVCAEHAARAESWTAS